MIITTEQLVKIMPNAKLRAILFIDALNAAMAEFEIDTPLRVASFIAQIAHESEQLLYTKEIASGIAYENRQDLGNAQPGDGRLYKGRGLIQITGRSNYTALMLALNLDCLEHPELIEQPINACRASTWWWKENNCNKWADQGNNQAVSGIVNTGSPTRPPEKINGLKERMAYYDVAKKVLGI